MRRLTSGTFVWESETTLLTETVTTSGSRRILILSRIGLDGATPSVIGSVDEERGRFVLPH